MKAVVLRDTEHLEVADVPRPPLGSDEVMVRVTDCGICGSDIRYLHGENPWAQHTVGEMRANPRNIIPGHEVAGVVDDVGDRADRSLLGKRVAVLCFRVDGTCWWCRHGEEELCPNTQHMGHGAGWGYQDYYYGGMAEFVPVWATHVFPLPSHVSTAEATLLDGLAVAVHALEMTRIRPTESALVMGTGTLGLLAVQALRVYGCTSIICADVDDTHLVRGAALGADHAINCNADDLGHAVAKFTDGIGARVIIDTVGRPLEEVLPTLARGGRLVNLAVHDYREDFGQIRLAGQRAVMTSANFKYSEWPVALELLFSGRIKAEPLITHRFPISQGIEAFQVADLKDKSGAIKVIINP